MRRGIVYLVIPIFACVTIAAYLIQSEKWMMFNCELSGRMKGPLQWSHEHVLETLRSQHLSPPSLLPLNLTHSNKVGYNVHKNLYNWDFFDHYNKEFFSSQTNGFFLEAGALDGEFLSNSLWLEQSQGWSGLLIEPDPVSFQHLVWKRRKAWISNTCISEMTYPREAIFESLQRIQSKYANEWLFRANAREYESYFSKIKDGFTQFSTTYYSKIQCFPLTSYFRALNVTSVDYLSLDIQGNEWEVIKTLSLQNVIFRVLAVEHFHERNGKQVDEDFLRYMEHIHYRLVDIDDSTNYIFVLRSDPLAQKAIKKYKRKNKILNLLGWKNNVT